MKYLLLLLATPALAGPPADNCASVCQGQFNYDTTAKITSYMANGTAAEGASGPKDAVGGKNESPSGVKPLDACLEKFMKGEAQMVLVAVPQEGDFAKFFNKCVRIKSLDDKAGKCVPVFAGDRYGKGSNGQAKMDVSHCDGGAAQQGHGDSVPITAQVDGQRGSQAIPR